MRIRFSSVLVTLVLTLAAGTGHAAAPYKGRSLTEVLAEFEREGTPVLFNTQLVPQHLRVTMEPPKGEPVEIINALLAPHGLILETGPGGRLLVTRSDDSAEPGRVTINGRLVDSATGIALAGRTVRLHPGGLTQETAVDGSFRFQQVPLKPVTLEVMTSGYQPFRETLATYRLRNGQAVQLEIKPLEMSLDKMTVTASHYSMIYADPASSVYLSREEVDRMPHIADDIFRAVNYLPGIANGDFSARLNVRGGAADELLVVLDGMRLYDPYHLKDLLAIFSIIDSNTVDGVDFYSGAFPAQFGATNSAVMAINSISPSKDYRHRLGLSFINTFAQTSGELADGEGYWLASARTGYLDVVLKIVEEDNGLDPAYFDMLGKTEFPVSDRSVLSVSALLAADNSFISDIDNDISDADFVDAYAWMELETDLNINLRLNHMLFGGFLSRDKIAMVDDGRRLQSEVTDDRDFSFFGFQQAIDWQATDAMQLRAGWEVRSLEASYDYEGIGVIGDLVLFTTEELPITRVHSSHLDPEGEAYSAFASMRQDWTTRLTTELGLRYDHQTYTGLDDNDQVSPRFNLLYLIGERTQARLALGRFYQPQEINQLQVQDGDESFYPAQLADQLVVSLQHRTEGGVELRAELYDKDYQDVRPYYENLFRENNILEEFETDRVRVEPEAARARGAEFGVRGGIPGGLQWWSSYTWSKSEDRIEGQWVPRSWDQRHAINLGVSFPLKKWHMTLAWRYHSGWPRTPVGEFEFDGEPVVLPVIGDRNSDGYGIYHRMDMRASRDIPVSRGSLRFYLEVINLYNRKNECCDDYDVFVFPEQVTFSNISEEWLPLLPSLGLKWEF
jgi:outer membrane cobalamin receptor